MFEVRKFGPALAPYGAESAGGLAAKYARKTSNKGGIWKEDSMASQGPCATITAKYGIPCNIDGAWKQGISNTPPSVYDQGVANKAQKWERNWVRGLSRG